MLLFIVWHWWLPWWLGEKITATLHQQGMSVQKLSWDYIGLHHSTLKTLKFRTNNADLHVNIRNLQADYQLLPLLNGKLDTIKIHAEHLNIESFQNKQASPIALISPLPLLSLIPVGRLHVNNVDVYQYMQQRLFRHWHGTFKLEHGDMDAQLTEQQDQLFHGMVIAFSLHQQGDLYASISQGGTQLASLEGSLHENTNGLQLQASLSMQASPMLQWMPVDFLGNPLTGTGIASVDIRATAVKGSYGRARDIIKTLVVDADWGFDGVLQQDTWYADGKITGHIQLADSKGTWQINKTSKVSAKGHDWQLQTGKHHLHGDFHIGEIDSYFTLNPKAFIQWQKMRWKKLSLDGASIQNRSTLRMTSQGRTSPLKLAVTIPPVVLMKQQLRADLLELAMPAPNSNKKLDASLHIQGFRWDNSQVHMPKSDVMLNIQWAKTLHATLRYDYAPHHPWLFDAVWQPKTDQGHINFSMSMNKPEKRLKALLPAIRPLFNKLALPSGSIRTKGRVSYHHGGWQGKTRLVLDELQGHYAKKTFSGLNADLQLQLNGMALSLSKGTVDIARVNAGVPMHTLHLAASAYHRIGGAATLHITALNVGVFGGQILASNIQLDTAKLDSKQGNPFTVEVKNISIAELLTLEAQQGLQATGILDGYFPANFRRIGLFVHQGHLAARPPGGLIRYVGGKDVRGLMAQNLGAKLAFQVLDNFQYHQLDADVNYHADGRLLLGLHLKGKNPAYDHGRPIELNINVEENLIMLFKSLSMADEISDQIEQRLINR